MPSPAKSGARFKNHEVQPSVCLEFCTGHSSLGSFPSEGFSVTRKAGIWFFYNEDWDFDAVLSFQGLRLKKKHWTLWDLWSNCETVKPNLPKWNGGHKINSDKWGFWISKGLFSPFNTHPGTQPHYRSGVLCCEFVSEWKCHWHNK